MIGDLFDSPWKILVVALVIIVLFGSKKLPSAARSLGQSMRNSATLRRRLLGSGSRVRILPGALPGALDIKNCPALINQRDPSAVVAHGASSVELAALLGGWPVSLSDLRFDRCHSVGGT